MTSLLDPGENFRAFREWASLLTRHRPLTLEMAKREIRDRYAGQFFGVFWAFGHPLILILVYIFIFNVVFKIRIGGTVGMPLDYSSYLLSGLIPWLAFMESMTKSSMAIIGQSNLVKQVVFPIEILPVKGVLASLVTENIFLALLTVYIAVVQHTLFWTFLLVPVLVLVQVFAMIGTALLLSAVAVFFRDMKDFVQVFSVVGVYMIPAFYLPESVPPIFRTLLYINPFSHMIWCFQDAFYFGSLRHPWSWAAFTVLSLVSFIAGYRVFRRLKVTFGNVI